MSEASLFLRAKLPQTSAKLCESLSFSINLKLQCLQQSGLEATNFKLDWASGKSLTTTLSSQEHLLLINNLKFELQCLRQSELNVLTLRLDWASPKTLTTTPSSLEYLLLTSIKEDLRLLGHLLTFNKFKTLFMGSN